MARKVRYRLPRSIQPVTSIPEIKDVLQDILYMTSKYRETITADYTISGQVAREYIRSNATSAVTVTCQAEPSDGDEICVSKDNTGNVTLDFNGKTDTAGNSTLTISTQGDAAHMEFDETLDAWAYL